MSDTVVPATSSRGSNTIKSHRCLPIISGGTKWLRSPPPRVVFPTEHHRQLRRALIASTVGTTIEWYDFLLYGTVTGLVFGKVFFPGSAPLIGVLQAFGVFFIGFVGRPIGAAIFGHFGTASAARRR